MTRDRLRTGRRPAESELPGDSAATSPADANDAAPARRRSTARPPRSPDARNPPDRNAAVVLVTTRPVLSGVLPIAPTTFDDDGALDLPSQRRALDFMIDAGSDAICLLANFSEQFALSDAERDRLFDVAMEHIAGRVPVILTASHFSARVTAERCRRAEAGGASAVMLMPPYHGATIRVGDDAIRGYFATVAAATDLPIIIQDSPVSGTPLSVDLLASLAETIPTVAYFKLETLDATVKLRALLDAGGQGILGPFDGEEGVNLAPDLDAGATGTMPSAMIPDVLGEVVRLPSRRRTRRGAGALRALAAAHPLREPAVRPSCDEGADAGRRASSSRRRRGRRSRRSAHRSGPDSSSSPARWIR